MHLRSNHTIEPRIHCVYDQNGCGVAVLTKCGDWYEVSTMPYTNTTGQAEQSAELIACFDENGTYTGISTRAKARANNERYLVVTNLIYHIDLDGQVQTLVQKRSPKKKIDPGKTSAAAHGVAKQLYVGGVPLEDQIDLAIVNAALEINEELRHGANTKQFRIIIWMDTIAELKKKREQEEVNDSNMIWLVPQEMYTDSSYPVGEGTNKRARAIFIGLVRSAQLPKIVIDPAEVESAKWLPLSQANNTNGTKDFMLLEEHALKQIGTGVVGEKTYGSMLVTALLKKRFA